MKRAGIMRVARPDQWTVQDWAHELEYAAANAISESLGQALRRAARALFHSPPGRSATWKERDKNDLAEIVQTINDGRAKHFNEAAAIVARKYTSDRRRIRSIVERLRRRQRDLGLKLIH
jgi:hypothetical protein